MICERCKHNLNEGDKFCGTCGLKVTPFNAMANKTNPNSTSIPKYKSTNKRKYKKTLIFSILFLIIIAGITTTIMFSKKDTYKIRTVMIYMIGSDLESRYVAATKDIDEIVKSKINYDKVNVLLYTGGAKKWHTSEIPNDRNAIFSMSKSGLNLETDYSPYEMGDKETLKDFLKYSKENFKAENYSLILWDHGGGPIYGYGYDEYSKKNSLSLSEIKEALDETGFKGNNKLEFIGFDACLMASAEVAYALSNHADYMIASQEAEPVDGWDYSFLSKINQDISAEEIGKLIVDKYFAYYEKSNKNQYGLSLSVLKLSKMNNFEERLDTLFSSLDKKMTLDFSSISRSRSSSKTFGKMEAGSYDLIDLADLLDNLNANYYQEVINMKSAINDVVVYQRTDLERTNGISLYFPYENKKNLEEIIYLYKSFSFANSYTVFIDNFSKELTGKIKYRFNLADRDLVVAKDWKVSLSLTKEEEEHYAKASYILFEKTEDNYYIPRFSGTDIILDDNKLTVNISKKGLVVKTLTDEDIYLTSIEAEKGKDYIEYKVPGTLTRWDDDSFDEVEVTSMFLKFIVNADNPSGKINGYYLLNKDNTVSYKMIANLNEWNTIQLVNFKYKITNDEGDYIENWEANSEVYGFEGNTEDNLKVELKDIDATKEYYVLFKVYDSQGNVYNTKLVKVENKQ